MQRKRESPQDFNSDDETKYDLLPLRRQAPSSNTTAITRRQMDMQMVMAVAATPSNQVSIMTNAPVSVEQLYDACPEEDFHKLAKIVHALELEESRVMFSSDRNDDGLTQTDTFRKMMHTTAPLTDEAVASKFAALIAGKFSQSFSLADWVRSCIGKRQFTMKDVKEHRSTVLSGGLQWSNLRVQWEEELIAQEQLMPNFIKYLYKFLLFQESLLRERQGDSRPLTTFQYKCNA